MKPAARATFIGMALMAAVATILLAACDDQVKDLETAAALRQQIESALGRIEAERDVPGLQHQQVTVAPDSSVGGFAIKIYDVRVGDAAIGLQSFRELTFSLVRGDATHFTAADFKFAPRPITAGPKAATDTLIEKLTRAVSVIQVSH